MYVWVVGGEWEGGGLSKLRKQLSKGSEAWDLVRGLKEAGDKAGQPEVGGRGWDAEESLYSGLLAAATEFFQHKRINEYPFRIFQRLCEGGVGREKLLLRFLLLVLDSLWGKPYPDPEPLWGWGWAVTQLCRAAQQLSRPWCWLKTHTYAQGLGGAWGGAMFPGLWHLTVGDIFPAKIRNQVSHPPFQQRVDSPVAEG